MIVNREVMATTDLDKVFRYYSHPKYMVSKEIPQNLLFMQC